MDSIIIFGAKYLFILVVLLLIITWLQANKKLKKEILTAAVMAGIIAVILDKICSKIYYDPRPFVSHNLHPLVAHAADNGFPSEHTLFSITLATIVFFYRPKLGVLAFAVALAVGISRVAAHVHSPVDIAGGVLIGVIAGWAGHFIAIKVLGNKNSTAIKSETD